MNNKDDRQIERIASLIVTLTVLILSGVVMLYAGALLFRPRSITDLAVGVFLLVVSYFASKADLPASKFCAPRLYNVVLEHPSATAMLIVLARGEDEALFIGSEFLAIDCGLWSADKDKYHVHLLPADGKSRLIASTIVPDSGVQISFQKRRV